MLTITNHPGNANQNHNEITPHACQNAIIKKTTKTCIGKGVEKKEHFYTVGGTVNWCSHYGKQCGYSSKR